MTSRLRVLAFAPFLASAFACGDDSASQVPPRAPAPVVAPQPNAAQPSATAPVVAVPGTGTAIGSPLTLVDLAKAMLALKLPTERAAVFATTTDGTMFQVVVGPDSDASFATALARSLGSVSTSSVPWPPASPPLGVEVLAIRGGSPLREAPNTRAVSTGALPDGAFFVSLKGTVPSATGALDSTDAWRFGIDSSGRTGWVQGSGTAVEEGCILPHDAIAGAVGLSLDDPSLASPLLGNMRIHRGGQSQRGTFVIAPSFVALLTRPANCNSATLDVRIDVDASVEEFHHALDQERGDTFLAIATEPQNGSDESAWGFYPPRATEPALSESLATNWLVPSSRRATVRVGVRRGPANARGYWAFSIKRAGETPAFYTSNGTAFAEAATDTAVAP